MKKNHPMSVFTWRLPKRYALRHPFRAVGWFFNALRMAKQRAVYGWCDLDVYDWYNWNANVLAGLLEDMSNTLEVPEDSKVNMSWIASDIRYGLTNTSEADMCDSEMMKVYSDESASPEDRAKAAKECALKKKEISNNHKDMVRKAFVKLGEGFFDLWR